MVRSQGASPLSFLIPEPNRNSECSQKLTRKKLTRAQRKYIKSMLRAGFTISLFNFALNHLSEWRKFPGPITEQREQLRFLLPYVDSKFILGPF